MERKGSEYGKDKTLSRWAGLRNSPNAFKHFFFAQGGFGRFFERFSQVSENSHIHILPFLECRVKDSRKSKVKKSF